MTVIPAWMMQKDDSISARQREAEGYKRWRKNFRQVRFAIYFIKKTSGNMSFDLN